MEDITAKSEYNGTDLPVPNNAVHTAAQYNDRLNELQNAVTNALLVLNSLDTSQLSKAMCANGIAAQSMLDSGGVNSIELTPITGASGLRLPIPIAPETPDYSALDGAIFSFKAANTNSGNTTVNVGQTGGALVGAQSLFLEDGSTQIPSGLLVTGRYYNIRYDLGATSFILLSNEFFLTGRKVVTTSTAADSTTTTNALTSPFTIADGKEAFTVTLSGLTVGDVVEVEAFAVLGNEAANLPQIAIFVDAVSASLAVGCNDSDTTEKGTCSINLKAWFTATSTSHTFRLRFVGTSSTTHLNNAFGNTNISWISATRLNSGMITVT